MGKIQLCSPLPQLSGAAAGVPATTQGTQCVCVHDRERCLQEQA